ncbi:GNAT family N-acetyltransferase [Devosia sp. CAU 1758]
MRLRDALPDRIETERLVLRHPRTSDLDALVAKANNWSVLEPTASLPFPYLEQHGRGFIERVVHHPDKRSYVLARREDDRLVGVLGVYFDEQKPAELGYWLGEAHWRQGLASEAVSALLGAASAIGLRPIRARVLAANTGSIRVLEKSGFVTIERTHSVVERHRGKSLLVMEWQA